jgi:hypothetical protein
MRLHGLDHAVDPILHKAQQHLQAVTVYGGEPDKLACALLTLAAHTNMS